MPPKNTKSNKTNPAKKEQIAEKVKEIQLRHKNWMQQREQHLKNSPDTSTSKGPSRDGVHHLKPAVQTPQTAPPDGPTGRADILTVHRNSSSELASQVSDKLNVKVKHGFGAWLESRKHNEDHGAENQTALHHGDYSGDSELNNSVNLQGERSHLSNSVSSSQNHSRNHLLSPAEFDSLADSIAARVKKDLGIRNNNVASTNRNLYQEADRDGPVHGRTFAQQVPAMQRGSSMAVQDGDDNGCVDVSSHQCPLCSSLMLSSNHVPMLQVPCGHTVCKLCSASCSSCQLCGTKVSSLTTNIMLQQIIQEFHWKNQQGAAMSHHSTAKANWGSPCGLPPVTSNTSAKRCDVNYSAQLRNLMDRQAALQDEVNSCRREKDRISSKVKRAEKQVTAITKEENSLLQQIQDLEDKLRDLKHHKEEYTGEYQRLQEDHKTASEQLMLVERTLASLKEEIDKVQFLAEGQEAVYLQK